MNADIAFSSEHEIQTAYAGDGVARAYVAKRFGNELNRLLHDRQVQAVQALIDRLGPRRVLEIAPGPGRITRCLRPRGALVCLEYNAGMIAEGRCACGPQVKWVRGNAFAMPFDGCFDLVYTFRFVRHFQREDRTRLYAELRRALAPGGYFLMDAVSERVSRPLREARPQDYPIYDKLYRSDELRTELRNAGFEVLTLQPVQKRFHWQYRSQVLLGPRANWLNRLVVRGLELLPGREGLEWIVLCRRA